MQPLVMDAAGNIYGTTNENGRYGGGNIFKLHPNGSGWTYTSLHDFLPFSPDGIFPVAGPTLGPLGKLYGTTSAGGLTSMNCTFEAGCGLVWEITP